MSFHSGNLFWIKINSLSRNIFRINGYLLIESQLIFLYFSAIIRRINKHSFMFLWPISAGSIQNAVSNFTVFVKSHCWKSFHTRSITGTINIFSFLDYLVFSRTSLWQFFKDKENLRCFNYVHLCHFFVRLCCTFIFPHNLFC